MKRFSDKEDRLYFIKWSDAEQSYTNCLSTDHFLSVAQCNHIVTIDHDMNDKHVLIRTEYNHAIYVVLRTWASELPILVHGKGFLLGIFATG